MFRPREAFICVEHFAEHIADVVASEFRITKAALESEVATLKDRCEALETRLKLQSPAPPTIKVPVPSGDENLEVKALESQGEKSPSD